MKELETMRIAKLVCFLLLFKKVAYQEWPPVPAVGGDWGPAAQHTLAAGAEGLSLSLSLSLSPHPRPDAWHRTPAPAWTGTALSSAARTQERAGGWRRRAAHDEEASEARAKRPRPASLSAHPRRRDSGLPGFPR